jgi:hypothetical protein
MTPTRRVFLGAAAALSTLPSVRAEEDEVESEGTRESTDEQTVAIEDGKVTASAEIGPANMHTPPGCFDDLEIKVWEDYYGIQIDIQADDNSDDRLTRFGMLLELDEDNVDELIAALEAFR